MQTENILVVNDLSVAASADGVRIPLVKNVCFSMPSNYILGLIGASGCGKSLTCLAVMGLLPKGITLNSGQIIYQKEAISHLPFSRMRSFRGTKLAMILQNPMSCFDAVFTIEHHFKETLLSHGRLPPDYLTKILTALSEVGFEDPQKILSYYPFQMSGGMLQRVMIAIALLMKVELLIADEPTTDLDVVSQAQVLSLLADMRSKHNTSILLVTHDLSVLAHLADDVMVMRKGEIIEKATVTEIFESSRHPYTRSLLNAHNRLYDRRLDKWFDDPWRDPYAKEACR